MTHRFGLRALELWLWSAHLALAHQSFDSRQEERRPHQQVGSAFLIKVVGHLLEGGHKLCEVLAVGESSRRSAGRVR